MNNILDNNNKSYANIKVWDLIKMYLIMVLLSIIFFGFATPAFYVIFQKYIYENKYINGRRLKFTGEAIDLYLLYIKWFFLCIITLGIYSFWIGVEFQEWRVKNIVFEDSSTFDTPSKFSGKVSSYLLLNIFTFIFTVITFGLGIPFLICLRNRWLNENSTINGEKLIYSGQGKKLFFKLFLWNFLSIITLGIYSFWYIKYYLEWDTSHTIINNTNNMESVSSMISELVKNNKILLIPILIFIATISYLVIRNYQYHNKEFFIENKILVKYNGDDVDIVIPEGIKKIGKNAFLYNTNIKTVVLPDGVEIIGESAFSDCSSLEQINLPTSVKKIENFAFARCDKLRVIIIPSSVETIGAGAFPITNRFTMLIDEKALVAGWDNSNFTHTKVFRGTYKENDNYIYEVNEDSIAIVRYIGKENKVIIPSSIEEKPIVSLANYAFEAIKTITYVEIPDSITEIGEYAFSQCDNLETVILPSNIQSLNECLFRSTNLKNIIIPASVSRIERFAFSYCESLENLILPDSVEYIGEYSFNNCKNLKTIKFSKNLEVIDQGAFSYCSSLKELEFPNILYKIENDAFAACGNLRLVWIPINVRSIGIRAFTNTNLVIYTEYAKKQSSWSYDWNYDAIVRWEKPNPFLQQ